MNLVGLYFFSFLVADTSKAIIISRHRCRCDCLYNKQQPLSEPLHDVDSDLPLPAAAVYGGYDLILFIGCHSDAIKCLPCSAVRADEGLAVRP